MLGFRGYPAASAVSIDHEIVHAIPSERLVEEGQLVTIQIGALTPHGSGDQGWTFGVGALDDERSRLRDVGRRALESGLAVLRAGARTGDLGAAIQRTIEGGGFAVVRDFVGYGVGERPLQDPQLAGYGTPGRGERLTAGMILHVHAIAAAGSGEVAIEDDRWTAVTEDGRPAALFTAMVRLRADGADLLTPLLG